jgi:catechol 2,3-dioxygenase-like lactoylglutathione lyase family enzyme
VILAFAHPGLVVPDLERAREFYERMFGFSVISKDGWRDNPAIDGAIGLAGSASRGYLLAGHNCFLELFDFEAPAQMGPLPAELGAHECGIRHLAFYVDDCVHECRRLTALGGSVIGVPAGRRPDAVAVYCRDPFGNLIELAEIPEERERPTQLPGIKSLGTFEGPETNDAGAIRCSN